LRMLDHETVHGDVVETIDTGQVQANDLHRAQGRNGDAANRMKRSAR
jgi:hypothetical protein